MWGNATPSPFHGLSARAKNGLRGAGMATAYDVEKHFNENKVSHNHQSKKHMVGIGKKTLAEIKNWINAQSPKRESHE